MGLRLPSRGMRVAPRRRGGVSTGTDDGGSGAVRGDAEYYVETQEKVPSTPPRVSSALRRLPQVGAERGPETVRSTSPARGVGGRGRAPDTYIDAGDARI